VFETVRRRNGGLVIALQDDRAAAPLAVPFLCECGSSLCPERVWLSPREYEKLMKDPGAPMIAPGHAQAKNEQSER
jgi:hypothetical protein